MASPMTEPSTPGAWPWMPDRRERAARRRRSRRRRVLTAPVNDFARVIDPASEQELERLIRALQTATGDVVVVATVPTFQPYGDIKRTRSRCSRTAAAASVSAARTTAC